MRASRFILSLLLPLVAHVARAESGDVAIAVASALSDLQSVSQSQMEDGLRLLAFTRWPAGKKPESQILAYRKDEHGVRIVYQKTFDGAYCAKLDVAYDSQRSLAPVLVLFVSYGAACQKTVVHRIKDGVPYVVQELEGGSFDWIPEKYPFLELLCKGPATVDPDERYRWNGSQFESQNEHQPNQTLQRTPDTTPVSSAESDSRRR